MYAFTPKLPFNPGCHITLIRVSYARQKTLGYPSFNIAVCTCPSQTPYLFFPLATVNLFSKSVSLFLFCKQVHLYHFFLVSIHKGCHFSISAWLHSIWQSLGPFILLWITSFNYFKDWLLFHWIHVLHLTEFFIHWWAFRLFPCLKYYKPAAMNIGVHVLFGIMFFFIYMPKSGIADSYGNSIFIFFNEVPQYH